ncbi:hypothetical protein ACIOKD_18750 [Streptomyces sp. NPDC087844]
MPASWDPVSAVGWSTTAATFDDGCEVMWIDNAVTGARLAPAAASRGRA